MISKPLPELPIPYLDKDQPWPVFDASNQGCIDQVDPGQRQLVSWLTLPLAAELVNVALVHPLEEEIELQDNKIFKTVFDADVFDQRIAKLQKQTRTGSAKPSFVHVALDPSVEPSMHVLVPTAQNRFKHMCFGLSAAINTLNAKEPGNITQTVLVKPKLKISTNNRSVDHRLVVPGNPGLERRAEPSSPLPVRRMEGVERRSVGVRLKIVE